MKKHLLCTTAAIAMVGGAASAQEWDVVVGGYYDTHVGFSDISGTADNGPGPAAPGNPLFGTDFDGLEIVQDGEVHVKPSITLDNGMTFGANIQFETGGSARYTDEVYISMSSDQFGQMDIGSENSAGYKMMLGTPSVGGVPVNTGSVSGFVPFATSGGGGTGTSVGIVNSFVGAGYSSFTEVGGALFGNSDIQRISYYTPSFNGFTAGFSYAPDAAGTDGANALSDRNAPGLLSDIFDIGVNYTQSYGTVDVAAAARWGTGSLATGTTTATIGLGGPVTPLSDPETWGIGAQVGFSGLTIGMTYAENDNGVAGGTFDEEGWTFGATYDLVGPWSVGFEYLHGEGDHGALGGGRKDELDVYKLAAARDLGPGVTWAVWAMYTEVDAADSTAAVNPGLLNGGPGTDIEATTIGTSIQLSF